MSERSVSGITLTLLLIGMLTLTFNIQPVESEATTIIVPNDYPTIQEAINAANEGDTIYVRNGTYYENVVLNKPNLTLIGEDKHTTVIDGNGNNVLSLELNNTKIKGFTLQNGTCGILMGPWTHGHAISNNIIENNNYGVSGHYDCFNVSICDNTISSNNIAGIQMLFSHSVIGNNLISDNGKGEFQEYGSGIQIVIGVNSEVVYCVNNTVFGNTIKNHQIGIWAIRYSEQNLFFHNNFVNNMKQFSGPATTWNNSITENYWSDYSGVDLYSGLHQNETGSDGIGDTAYVIDQNNQDKYPLMHPWGVPCCPKTEFTATPETANVGESIKFDGSASLSGWNGTHTMPITEYRWDFGGGIKITTSTPILYYSFISAGTYYATLTVYAPGATPETDSTTHKVTITAIPVGGYSFPIKRYTTAKPLTMYLTLVAILTSIFATIKHETHRRTKRSQCKVIGSNLKEKS